MKENIAHRGMPRATGGGGRRSFVRAGVDIRSLVLVATLVCAVGACQRVTAEHIESWKGTVKGPDKLQDAFTSSNVDPELRARAGLALLSLGRGDFVAEKLERMPPEARGPVVAALVRLHLENLKAGESVNAVQEARDGLFALRTYAADEDRKAIDAALLAVIRKQVSAKTGLGGSHSLGMIVEALGAQAAPVLVELMQQASAPHAELAELLLKVGDDEARIAASTNLVSHVRGAQAIDGGTWRALGLLGGPDAVAYLKEQVDKGAWQRAEQAARALQLRPQPSLGDFALARAGDPKVHGNVREEMFGLAESCCGGDTLAGLLDLLAKSKDMLVRYRAFESALRVAGPTALDPALSAFPPQAVYKAEDVEDFLVKDTIGLDAKAHGAVLRLLESPVALKRMVGVLALEKLGGPSDVPLLQRLATDKGLVKGFPSARTVGHEAGRVASLLAKGA